MGMMSEIDLCKKMSEPCTALQLLKQEVYLPVPVSRETAPFAVVEKKSKERRERYHNEKILNFVRYIRSTDGFENSIRMIKTKRGKNAEHGFGTLAFFRQNDEEKMRYWLNTVRFGRNRDYYITKNSYCGNHSLSETLFSLDNIVIDIDNHKRISLHELDRQVDRLIWVLDNDFNGMIPPYGIVYSGRGVQLWIGLESVPATEKWQYRYQQLTEYFCNFLDNIIKDYKIRLEVDRAASMRINGFVRLPETWNTKRKDGRKIIAERFPLYRMHIYDILEEYTDIPFDRNKKPAPKRAKACQSVPKRAYRPQNGDNYTPYQMKCMRFIERLVNEHDGNCDGRRELLLFHYYNSAIQVYEKETATEMVKELNQKFSVPLRNTEVSCAVKSPDKKIYRYSVEKFLCVICISEEEKQWYYECTYDRKKDREQARQAKQERNQQIFKLHEEGRNRKEIAETIGCCAKTVSEVLPSVSDRDNTIERLYLDGMNAQEIADSISCSKKTVERLIKSRNLKDIRKEKRDEAIISLYQQGISKKAIAETVHCSRTTVTDVISAYETALPQETDVPETVETEIQETETVEEEIIEIIIFGTCSEKNFYDTKVPCCEYHTGFT